MEILYIKGDATAPIGSGVKVITHICNDIGGWGKGFVLALSKKWKMPEEAYRQWYKSQEEFTLGAVQFVNVENVNPEKPDVPLNKNDAFQKVQKRRVQEKR
ncbi:MAG: hypothetical protein ACLVLB_15195 [Bacteroides thetaiotaomicron]